MRKKSRSHSTCIRAVFYIGLIFTLLFPAARVMKADPFQVTVPGRAAIWLAGQPEGTAVFGDSAPMHSPVRVDLNAFPSAQFLSFAATGSVNRDPDFAMVTAEGEVGSSALSRMPVFSLSGIIAPFSSLVGVFIDEDETFSIPPSFDFGTSDSRSFLTLSPEVQQVFYIGDGLTGVGEGDEQMFEIPAGADVLYLGVLDVGNFNNGGELQVTITGTALTQFIPLDIKPGSCPNPLNTRGGGVLPVAILGTPDFDVTEVAVETIHLVGVSPVRYNLEDVGTPFEPFIGREDCSDCSSDGPDGLLDLTLKFDRSALVEAIETELGRPLTNGECLILLLTGNLTNSVMIEGEDVVLIKHSGPNVITAGSRR